MGYRQLVTFFLLVSSFAEFAENYRLPNNTIPIHYDINLTTNLHSDKSPILQFQGEVIITIKVEEPNTNEIVVHARQLEDFEAKLLNVNDQTTKELKARYDGQTTEFLTLSFYDNSKLINGNIYKLSIKYKGLLREDNGGFYISTYTNSSNGKTVYMATTQFAPTDARHAFPCYDEPAKRANFTITINHDPSLRALSNMPVDGEKSTAGKTVFQQTPNMPTYLVAFIITDFESTSGSLNGLTQRVFSRPGTQTDQQFALLTGMKLISHLTEYFGVPYQLPKLDQVAIPDFAAGAMENWGLVTYREENLLYNRENSTLATQTSAGTVIGHEYTHLWFGNLVTMKWWTWLWLKEGFANYFSYKAINEIYPEWDINQMYIIDHFQKALGEDAENKTRPMTCYAEKQKDIRALYDTVAYSKSGSVLRMWQHVLTDDVFRAGLHKYLVRNQYTGANDDDLFDALTEAADEAKLPLPDKIHKMLKTWTNQNGAPILTVHRNYGDGSFNITQKSFYSFNTSMHDDKLWYIPINFATVNTSNFRQTTPDFYLNSRSTVIQSKLASNEWLILNKQSTGYYRVNYDEQNWKLLTSSLIESPRKIHAHNKASLLFDAYSLMTTSNLQHKYLLSLMTYLRNEEQYAPWATAEKILSTFDMFLRGHVNYPSFKAFIADLIGNSYNRLGIQTTKGEHHLTNYVRVIAINWACIAGIHSCLDESRNKFQQLVKKNIEIDPNLQQVVYCNHLRNASDADFEYVYNRLMNSQNQAERKILISALGCVRNRTNLMKFVKSSIDFSEDVTLRSPERITILNSAYSQSEVGLSVCIEFLFAYDNDYARLNGNFKGNNPLDDDVKKMSKYVKDENQYLEFMNLVSYVKNHPRVSADLEKTVQKNIDWNFDWIKANQKPIMDWMTENYKISGASRIAFGVITPLLLTLHLIVGRIFK